PLGPQLADALNRYLSRRNREHCSAPDAPCFPFKSGKPISRASFERRFRRLCRRVRIQRIGGARVQPRLHDLRHSAAVHRVINWYRDGKDVQRQKRSRSAPTPRSSPARSLLVWAAPARRLFTASPTSRATTAASWWISRTSATDTDLARKS